MQQHHRTTPDGAPTALTRDEIQEAIAHSLGVAPADIDADDNLVVLGLGSLEMMRLVNRWKRQGVGAEFRDLAATPTLRAWWAHLAAPA